MMPGMLITATTASGPPPSTGLVQMTSSLQRLGWAGHLFLLWLLR